MPCTVFFEDAEWKALVAYKTQNPIPPENPPTLREAIHMVASLGDFLGRKCDGEPGTQTLWLGLQRLDDITEMWKISLSALAPHLFHPPPVSGITCLNTFVRPLRQQVKLRTLHLEDVVLPGRHVQVKSP